MNQTSEALLDNDPRRRLLLRALAAGWLVGGSGWQRDVPADTFGARPHKLPAGQSIFELDGRVRINGVKARRDMVLKPGDVIETDSDGRLVGVIGSDALIIRPQSRVEIGDGARSFFRLVTGAMLSVFGKRNDTYEIRMPVATVGIRGTGVYSEADAEKSYVCLCYGTADLTPLSRPEKTRRLVATHHDAPMFLYGDEVKGRVMESAPFYNHTDLELMTLEALVGRTVPFSVPDDPYAAPRRDY